MPNDSTPSSAAASLTAPWWSARISSICFSLKLVILSLLIPWLSEVGEAAEVDRHVRFVAEDPRVVAGASHSSVPASGIA